MAIVGGRDTDSIFVVFSFWYERMKREFWRF
jgi:hypothetical protein